MKKRLLLTIIAFGVLFCMAALVQAWTLLPVSEDPLVRMPGTQPDQGVNLEAPGRCLNCHEGYNQAVEPGHNWKGSMMAQASRDPIFWACMTVAGQDSIWALGNPNAVDICERCHFPEGWLGGRSDPPNASAMTGSDFDGLHCDFCHTMYDPFFETTFDGTREGNDWTGYWDENGPLSPQLAAETYAEDSTLVLVIRLFTGTYFYSNNVPRFSTYTENASGQYFISTSSQKRASFADAAARHQMFYSRYHKSKYFCATCHDVSNPALTNLGLSGLPDNTGGEALITEQYSASKYFHVERTFSEFMLSAYAVQGGAATNADFQQQGAPDITWAAKCQDCHMRDVTGKACNKNGVPLRPDESTEHPNSGVPLHDLTGGNAWITHILASTDPNGPVYDAVNAALLDQGPSVLTLDLNAGETPKVNGAALKDGSDRAKQQLRLAATIRTADGSQRDTVDYDPGTGNISFRVQNNSGHKLISGFPEGRRMFVNIKAYAGGNLIYEVNPYSDTAGTLKGLPNSPNSPPLGANEVYVDELVYEVHPNSSLTGEDHQTFHFVLATGRYKDNRIPPRGFDIASAAERISEPVIGGVSDTNYFTQAEYDGGYDAVSTTIASGADYVLVTVNYQGTSREYIEFLRDEINGNASSLPYDPQTDPNPYLVQTDPFFSQLKEWGNTIWSIWEHNHGLDGSGVQVDGIVPFEMTAAEWGTIPQPQCDVPGTPQNVVATGGRKRVTITWDPGTPPSDGYNIYYDQAGKLQFIATVVAGTTSYTDTGLVRQIEYCYVVKAVNDCNGNGTYDPGIDLESAASTVACATTK